MYRKNTSRCRYLTEPSSAGNRGRRARPRQACHALARTNTWPPNRRQRKPDRPPCPRTGSGPHPTESVVGRALRGLALTCPLFLSV